MTAVRTPQARLAAVVRGVLRRAGAEAVVRLRRHPDLPCPPLRPWVEVLAAAAGPLLTAYFHRGGRGAARRILAAVRRRPRPKMLPPNYRVKDLDWARLTPEMIFDILHPGVANAIQAMAFDFAESTLATLTMEVDEAMAALRETLGAALSAGEGLREIAARVRLIFDDRDKAILIARTEAQRSIYAGEVYAAKRSGVVKGHKWLCGPACCPKCQELDGKEVSLGQPFTTHASRKAAYAVVYHPPLHPRCRCSLLAVIDPRYLP